MVAGCAFFLVAFIFYVSFSKFRSARRNPNGLPLPPGPPGLPLIGNAHQLLGKNMVTVLDQWAKAYGPLIHFKLFGRSVIAISSSEVARDLLEARHRNYSDRPGLILASKAMQGGLMLLFMQANERFHRIRKLVTTELRPRAIKECFNPVQTLEIHKLIQQMLNQPEKWSFSLARAVASMLMSAVYDKPLQGGDEEDVVKTVTKLNDDLMSAIVGGQNYVDFFPWLQYIPGVPYQAPARTFYQLSDDTYKSLMDDAKRNLEEGLPAKSLAARLLQRQHEIEADYQEQYWALGSFYMAGSDTQVMASQSLILALALNPHVLARAQAEVDDVVGDDRCPTYDDEDQLPYIRAMVREVLRWRPTGPTAIPHASTADDEYNGYFIPGGSMVIPNVWSMQMDPKVFDRPEEFEPKRYLDNPHLPLHAFGFGGRVCPGRRVAEQTMFLMFATLVWCLDIKLAVDPTTDKPIPLDPERETGYVDTGFLRPRPFTVSITPRNMGRANLLARIVESERE